MRESPSRRGWAVMTGLLCFIVAEARSQGFEQRLAQIQEQVVPAAAQLRQDLARTGASQERGADMWEPTDALDETKAGVAAKFLAIKPDEFEMGSPLDEGDRFEEETPHSVTLTRGFEMQATEVTQLQYFLVMGRNPSGFKKREDCDKDNFKVLYGLGLCVNHPAETVSWEDAQEFIGRLNQIQNRYAYRLPTEAEWEHACRGGMPSSFPYSFGFNDTGLLDSHGWHYGNSGGRTHAAASKKANPFGLYDMNGNVWEWVEDWYRDYPPTAATDPAGPTSGSGRVRRGGSWYNGSPSLRSARRSFGDPDDRWRAVGFRLVRSRRRLP